ncbi:hypothetical protein DWB84_15710 [Saccharophagus sp. K07]|nr:hypothetical protein [Saccharophagus sp. K07]
MISQPREAAYRRRLLNEFCGESHLWDKQAICSELLDFLRQQNKPVGEYDLIRHLNDTNHFASLRRESANLLLFRKHFITRHCLYSLQQELAPGWALRISMLEIQLEKVSSVQSDDNRLAALDGELRRYYLDLANLDQATEQSVDELLKNFWKRFSAYGDCSEACKILGVDESAQWPEILLAYRRKARSTHPDMGGSAEEFRAVQDAFEILKNRFGK